MLDAKTARDIAERVNFNRVNDASNKIFNAILREVQERSAKGATFIQYRAEGCLDPKVRKRVISELEILGYKVTFDIIKKSTSIEQIEIGVTFFVEF